MDRGGGINDMIGLNMRLGAWRWVWVLLYVGVCTETGRIGFMYYK